MINIPYTLLLDIVLFSNTTLFEFAELILIPFELESEITLFLITVLGELLVVSIPSGLSTIVFPEITASAALLK